MAHIIVTDCPFDENFTGAVCDAAAGGTAAVPPFVTNVTPPSFAWGGSSFGEEGNVFPQGSLRGPTAHPLNPGTRRFLPYRVGLITLSLRFSFWSLYVWNLQCTPSPVTLDWTRLPNWRTPVTLHELTILFLLFVELKRTFLRVTHDR